MAIMTTHLCIFISSSKILNSQAKEIYNNNTQMLHIGYIIITSNLFYLFNFD